jgi:hypothetical protein
MSGLVACKVTGPSQKQEISGNEVVQNINLSGFECKKNETGSHKLCYTKQKSKKTGLSGDTELNTIMVIHDSSNSVILKESIKGGMARWVNDRNVEIYYPGGFAGNEKVMIYNVDKKKKIETEER